MRSAPATAVGLLLVALSSPAAAQVVQIDSARAALDSRYVWREYDRGAGATLDLGTELGLAGYSKNPFSQNNLTFNLAGWLPLADRDGRRAGDQGQATLVYGRCVLACDRLPWWERWTLSVAVSGYWVPRAADGERYSEEGQFDFAGLLQIQQLWGRQLGIRLFPALSVAHDFRRYDATYARGSVGTQLGPLAGFAFGVDAGVALSDFPTAEGKPRDFGYHGSGVALSINREFSVCGQRTVGLRAIWQGVFAAEDTGPEVGVATLRVKWY